MDVETTDKQTTMDASNGKDGGVSRSKAPSSSAIARTLKLSGVELKIVGETLGILKDYKESLDLVCVAEGDACRITFRKGVRYTDHRLKMSIHDHFSHLSIHGRKSFDRHMLLITSLLSYYSGLNLASYFINCFPRGI